MVEQGGKAGRKCKVLFMLFPPDWQVPSAGAVTHPRLPCWRRLLAAHQSRSPCFQTVVQPGLSLSEGCFACPGTFHVQETAGCAHLSGKFMVKSGNSGREGFLLAALSKAPACPEGLAHPSQICDTIREQSWFFSLFLVFVEFIFRV